MILFVIKYYCCIIDVLWLVLPALLLRVKQSMFSLNKLRYSLYLRCGFSFISSSICMFALPFIHRIYFYSWFCISNRLQFCLCRRLSLILMLTCVHLCFVNCVRGFDILFSYVWSTRISIDDSAEVFTSFHSEKLYMQDIVQVYLRTGASCVRMQIF